MRIVSWYSHGVASAVATKLALEAFKRGETEADEFVIANCEVREEHPDNKRFLKDCQEWFGQEIQVLGNDDYSRSIYQVFLKTRYLVGPGGARCTGELKKAVREKFQRLDDIHILGYTAEEKGRIDRFIDGNPDLDFWPILMEKGLTKGDCLALVDRAGIPLPEMYGLGFKNNNCIPCVKSSSPAYYALIKQHFPAEFSRMSQAERDLGRSVCKIDMETVKKRWPQHYDESKQYWRPQLHELPDDIEPMDNTNDVQCGMFCLMAEQDL